MLKNRKTIVIKWLWQDRSKWPTPFKTSCKQYLWASHFIKKNAITKSILHTDKNKSKFLVYIMEKNNC